MDRKHLEAAIRAYLVEVEDGFPKGEFIHLYPGTYDEIVMNPKEMANYICNWLPSDAKDAGTGDGS